MKYDITLVFPSSPFLLNEQVFPPLGILYLSAYLKDEGFKVQCLDMSLGHTVDMIEADIVGVSFTTPQRQQAFDIAASCNLRSDRKFMTIAGGAHPTHMPEECLEHGFDIVVQGEGEEALASIISELATGRAVKRVFKDQRNSIWIDDLPFPDRDAVDIHQYEYKINGRPATTLMTTRGCPYSCSFCARAIRRCNIQSAERTIMEVDHLASKYGFSAFMIFDDVFIVDKRRTRLLADAFAKRDLLFRCFARANLIDEENVEMMRKMGVVEVGIGVESGSDKILSMNLKGTTREMNSKAVKMLHNAGIRAKAFLIVGLPGESIITLVETMTWIEEAQPYDIDVSIFQPLPGSPIFNDPKKWGIKFQYDGNAGWYKGRPGEYEAGVSTDALSSGSLISWRDYIEGRFKKRELLR